MKKNPFRAATYLLNAHRLDQLPPDTGAELAFAGRSNAGKSSALNSICDQQGLARTSKTPGRTQQLVVFPLDDTHRLIDLPGYGYAKVPESMRLHWRGVIDAYLRTRDSLKGLVLVMDSRHPLREFDRQMLGFAQRHGTQEPLPADQGGQALAQREPAHAARGPQGARDTCAGRAGAAFLVVEQERRGRSARDAGGMAVRRRRGMTARGLYSASGGRHRRLSVL